MPSLLRRTAPATLHWPTVWHALMSGASDAVTNMATDLALLDLAGAERIAVLRTYGWSRPTVSFGRHEPVRDVWNVPAVLAAGYDVVRRPSGGRALLHDHAVTYSVVLPLRRDVPWRTAYDAVNRRLLGAMRALGVPAEVWTEASAPAVSPDGPPCFAAPAAGELAVHGRKLVGSAVWRTAEAYLQHGVLLLRDSQSDLGAFRTQPRTAASESSATGLVEWLAAPEAELADLATAALHAAWRNDAEVREWSPAHPDSVHDFSACRDVHAARLRDREWLWRR